MAPDLHLHFSPDEMVAYVNVTRSSSFKPSSNILHSLLKRQRVVYGVNEALLDEIAAGKITGQDIPVATGKAVRPSVPGRYEWLVDCFKTDISKSSPGNVDCRTFRTSAEVRKGDRIARILPPVPGASGVTVTGNIIPVDEVTAAYIKLGDGVTLEHEYAVALFDGVVIFNGTEVAVCTIRKIAGDVDMSTGNISYNGILHIEGSVRTGCRVHSSGNIYIGGDVEDAEIKGESSVIVEGGAVGAIRGVIECEGSLYIGRASHFSLIAGKDVTVKDDALHTAIIADGNVHVNTVVGGSVNAFSITVSTAGAKNEVPTILDITRMQQLVKERYDLLKAFGAAVAERTVVADTIYSLVRDGMDEQGCLQEQDIGTLDRLKETMVTSITSTNSMQERLALIEKMELCRTGGSYVKAERVFPGTIVKTIREERTLINEECNVLFAS